jgi:hypothetical protein
MTEDTRVCPVCRKFPPAGQVWVDFGQHVWECAEKFYDRDQNMKRLNELEQLEALDKLLRGMIR